MDSTEKKLRSMGIELPNPPKPVGAYVPVKTIMRGMAYGTMYVSGQIPVRDGEIKFAGKVSDGNIEKARESAKLCAVNVLAQLRKALHDCSANLDHITGFVMLSGFVNSDPGFTAHPKVIDAASGLLFEVFGERGRHARIAVGASSLPLDAMTEIGAVVEFHK